MTYNFCIKTFDPSFQLKMFGDDHINPGVVVACLLGQSILYFTLNVGIDHWRRNTWRSKGGRIGNLPPHLPVNQDVFDHENEVRAEPEQSEKYPIRVTDLNKTYSSSDV